MQKMIEINFEGVVAITLNLLHFMAYLVGSVKTQEVRSRIKVLARTEIV